jgi:hypothetical protein
MWIQRGSLQKNKTNTNQLHANTKELRDYIQQSIANRLCRLQCMLFQKESLQKDRNMLLLGGKYRGIDRMFHTWMFQQDMVWNPLRNPYI